MGISNQTRTNSRGNTKIKPINWRKVVEVSFWGAVIWGIIRLVFSFFHFTPYGVQAFSRPIFGAAAEDSYIGILVGFMIMFGFTLGATAIFAYVFSTRKIWWLGSAYGAALFILFGLLFRMQNWKLDTFSTELLWFLSIGLFIGMSLTAERFDEE